LDVEGEVDQGLGEEGNDAPKMDIDIMGNDEDDNNKNTTNNALANNKVNDADWGIDGDSDLDLGDDSVENEEVKGEEITNDQNYTNAWIQREDTIKSHVITNSLLPGEHFAVGNFEKGIDLLKNQVGLCNKDAIVSHIMDTYLSSSFKYSSLAFTNPVTMTNTNKINSKKPFLIYNMDSLNKKLQKGYQLTNPATFNEALTVFRDIVKASPLINVSTKNELAEVEKLINHCLQYIIMITADMAKKTIANISKQKE